MIHSRLLQAQLELSSHRLWLTSFLHSARPLHQRCRISTSITTSSYSHSLPTRSSCRQYNSLRNPRKRRTEGFVARKSPKILDGVSQLDDLKIATRNVQIEKVVQLYAAIEDKAYLADFGFRMIAQCLHQALRSSNHSESNTEQRRAYNDFLRSFAETLVADVRRGTLEPNCRAHMHLLGFFKESGARDTGVRFWKWLERRDERHVDADVYGAAIELLAVNGSPLAEMEDLYRQAFTSCRASFMDYHLLPEAVVPDREQMTTLKGVPMSLLQGILTARLLRGDSRNAYLTLDTALRLYPDQVPHRFFQLFVEERPVEEAYTVFAMACRAGISLPSSICKQLVAAVRLRIGTDLRSPTRYGLAVRSMLSTLYVYMCAGGPIKNNSVTELVIAMTQFLRLNGVTGLEIKDRRMIVDEVTKVIAVILEIFARQGAKPGLSAFNSIITNLGGFGQSKQIIGIALKDALALGLRPNAVTHRSIVTAAGVLRDDNFVKEAWRKLLEARTNAGEVPDATDFRVFARSANANGLIDFAREEFGRLKKKLPDTEHDRISSALDSPEYEIADAAMVDQLQVLEEIRKIRLDLNVIDDLTKNGSQVQSLRDAPFPITLVPSEEVLPEADMRQLYDELTTEPSLTVEATDAVDNPPQTSSIDEQTELSTSSEYQIGLAAPAVSSTNIPFGKLRYENWKTVNQLLAQAEASDQAYINAVDQAIAAGKVPPKRPLGLSSVSGSEVASFGLSDTVSARQREASKQRHTMDQAQIQEGRTRILRLRARDVS